MRNLYVALNNDLLVLENARLFKGMRYIAFKIKWKIILGLVGIVNALLGKVDADVEVKAMVNNVVVDKWINAEEAKNLMLENDIHNVKRNDNGHYYIEVDGVNLFIAEAEIVKLVERKKRR